MIGASEQGSEEIRGGNFYPTREDEGLNMDSKLMASVDEVVAVLREAGAQEIYLFGSAATGSLREDSDLDFAVSGLPPQMFFRAVTRAQRCLRRGLDLVDLDQDTPFTRYLKEEGELVRVG